ncbi:hypothetical protein HHK36_005004 [Tetracentron sinense]|uniref:1,3-beta-glucan synthase component FKS1-like domain-containing protein n=1 Tax=Tetracentron sinense TaxID=13715 RepID=A0A835DQC9_TETSI|nr:hypothetical protein HHK36_005004 [Tetracentron sinense]
MASSSGTKSDMLTKSPFRQPTMVDDTKDTEIVPPSLDSIVPILRVANELEKDNPRVAYLCRFHAFERAHSLDPTSMGRGSRQFKTYLLNRLKEEEETTKQGHATNDPKEIQMFYRKFYEENIKDGLHIKNPEEMAKIYQIATVLYDVLKTVVPFEKIDKQIIRYAKEVEKKKEHYTHYNILPLHSIGPKPAIMELPEIKAAISALRKIGNLPNPSSQSISNAPHSLMPLDEDNSVPDLLDWLWLVFGFQLDYDTVQHLTNTIFKNYHSWCKYLHLKSNLKFPLNADLQQLKLLYIGLYLLIWGEASNIRFMPECICYIFHNRANQVTAGKTKPKTNFVEVRTFWHLFRSFDRMWIFLILAFQAMVIVAWSPSGSPAAFFDEDVFKSVLSIFITSALLNYLQVTLDIILSWKAWGSLKYTEIFRYLLKFAVAAPKLYVGRGMHEDMFSLLKYTLFWILLLISKLAFSFYVEILPLIGPTKLIMGLRVGNYEWYEFFRKVNHNLGVVISIWAPIVLVYFTDTQIWYTIFSTIFGGIHGAFSHLGETAPCQQKDIAKFSKVWNEFINCMRAEDLISNRERDLLLLPYFSSETVVQWPPFMLASKIAIALDMAKDFKGRDADLSKKIKNDLYMHSAVTECYKTFRELLSYLLDDEEDKL